MKVILQQDVRGQGKKGQMIDAAEGYARNYLLPRKLAIPATADAINTMNLKEKARRAEEAANRAAAVETADKLRNCTVKITAKGGANGKLFGAITGKEISLNPFPVPKWVKWGLFSLTMLISLFILLVYGTLFYGAFTKTWGYDWSLTMKNIQYVFLKGKQIWNSIRYGFLASLGASFLAMVLAYIVQKKQVGINRLLDFLGILPGAIPGMFLGIGFVMAFNAPPLELTGTSVIMVLALLFWNIPTCYSSATAGLQQIGASVEDAALNLGANSFRSFKDVIIPLLKAPFMSSFVLSFLRSVTCLSVVIFLYAPSTTVGTISVMVLVQSGQYGEAAAFTIVLITIAFTVLKLAQWVLGKQGIELEL